jgi:patatin-like phospholipase/acyl hydrolase
MNLQTAIKELEDAIDAHNNATTEIADHLTANAIYSKSQALLTALKNAEVGEVRWDKVGVLTVPYFTKPSPNCFTQVLNHKGTLYFSKSEGQDNE